MPCEDCGHLLCRYENQNSLFCPRCRGLRVESQSVVNAKTDWLLKDYFTEEKILGLLQEYNKPNLIYNLLQRLNQISYDFSNELRRGLPLAEFGYLAYILKQLYEADHFGEKLVEDSLESSEDIEVVQEAYTELLDRIRRAQNRFTICIRKDDYSGRMEEFSSDYNRLESEYGLCFNRCVQSIVCGDPKRFEDYSYVVDVLRAVDKTDTNNIETPWDFADAWYQLLLQFRFIAASDNKVGPTYYTQFPDEVTIFDIDEFLGRLDSLLDEEIVDKIQEDNFVPPLRPEWVEECGRKAFGNNWGQVKDQIIVSEDNLDAHPFLFELDVVEKQHRPGFRRPRKVPTPNIYYPRYYSQLLKFQVFPMVQNGDFGNSGHELLTQINGDRGDKCERNLYDFLTENGVECYHSAEIQKNQDEIDLLCIYDDRIVFIEVKYLLPPIRINEPDGIKELDEDFNRLIFNEVSEESDRQAKGRPFPEKVETWMQLEPGDSFWSQISDEGDRDEQEIPDAWNQLEVEKYVISNVVPSYIMKEGVRFLTDLEFYRLIEHDDTDVLYSLP